MVEVSVNDASPRELGVAIPEMFTVVIVVWIHLG